MVPVLVCSSKKATQKQHAYEREVRKYKRRIATGQAQDLDMMADRQRLGHTQALLREHCRENNLTRNYERERAYGVAKQPRGLGRFDFKNDRALRAQESENSIKHKRKSAPKDLIAKTTVNPDLINSKKFAAKFKKINENKQTRKELLRHAKIMLITNSGTLQEGMACIDTRNGETFWSVKSSGTDAHVEAPLEAIKEIRARNEQAGEKVVVALHTHPRGYPPSAEDFVACARKEYKAGYVAGSNGSVYEYTASGEFITSRLISDKFLKQNPTNNDAGGIMINTIKSLSKDYDISCGRL